MPKIRQCQDRYALEAFLGELRAQMGRLRYKQAALADRLGVSQRSVSTYLRDPGKMPLEVFCRLVETLEPDPAVTMAYLKFKKSKVKEYQNEQV